MRTSEITQQTGRLFLCVVLFTAVRPSFAFPVPPPLLARPSQPQQPSALTQTELQAIQDQAQSGQEPDQAQQEQAGGSGSQSDQSDAQTFEGCGLNRDAALMKAELLMTQARGDTVVSGHQTLRTMNNNDQYNRSITENTTMLTNGHANILAEWGGSGRVCVRIAP
ncbi:hypothetical protein [Ferrovum myxofaciens]|uniref:Uncharacterized protein n=1 Tax=Ferrovum myxofaciens TaxID=416213 RepID=A0A9E6MYT9_9PROT|nr:hypothetical protein [Ferrovum myxofaciens]QKE37360.1 MAG: hypothetical protein HO273_00325 [Ferrovum myxofaciens]QWY75016.1 MAG: hypothetical protein JVY19_00795 [Ferrovum myxofaciens]QWY77756.1 MAG: hypothetical protein JZL65_01325 [Ferrovum myxofaciens]